MRRSPILPRKIRRRATCSQRYTKSAIKGAVLWMLQFSKSQLLLSTTPFAFRFSSQRPARRSPPLRQDLPLKILDTGFDLRESPRSSFHTPFFRDASSVPVHRLLYAWIDYRYP